MRNASACASGESRCIFFGRFRCNSDAALKQAALDGIGIMHFPKLFIQQELADGRFVRLLEDYGLPRLLLCFLRAPTCC